VTGRRQVPPCTSCGDPAAEQLQGKPYCSQCYRELRFGRICAPRHGNPCNHVPSSLRAENEYHGIRNPNQESVE